MRKLIICLVLLLLAAPCQLAAQKKSLSLHEIIMTDNFDGDYVQQPEWLPNSQSFTFHHTDPIDSVSSIYIHHVETGKETVLLDGHTLTRPGSGDPISLDEYCLSPDGRTILIHTDTVSVWRHSQQGRCFLYDIDARTTRSVYDGEERIFNARVSPDGAVVGYVLKSNIYTRNLSSGETKQWTSDGSDDIINGQFDWAYEEEFSIADGWQWSPDSKKIAFWRLDQAAVREFSWIDYNPTYQDIVTIRYPKAGEANSLVQIGVVDTETGQTVWMDIGAETDIYIPRMQWTNNSDTLCIQRLNRDQNRLDLIFADIRTGQSRIVLTETDPCWVDVVDSVMFLSDGRFVWLSERDGYRHIYLYQNNGRLLRQVTSGPYEVSSVYGVDEETYRVFFGSDEKHVLESHIYAADLSTGQRQRLTQQTGWHKGIFSPDFGYFIHEYSNIATPTKTFVMRSDGSMVRLLKNNPMLILDDYSLSYPEYLTVETSDGAILDAFTIKPVGFDSSRQYPVLVYCYGGPEGRSVENSWYKDYSTDWFLKMNHIVQQGYIVFSVDNRGIGGHGKADKNLVYTDLAKWAVHDQIEGAKYLQTLPYVDPERIGIYGWSFGGYLALLAMTVGADYFAAGVSGAPVTDWTLYDAIYTERFMKRPNDNPDGYRAASVFTYVDSLKGKLLLIHGMTDDNVHVQNSMQLMERLQMAGKQFDVMLYPGKAHGMAGRKTKLHMWESISRFITDNL